MANLEDTTFLEVFALEKEFNVWNLAHFWGNLVSFHQNFVFWESKKLCCKKNLVQWYRCQQGCLVDFVFDNFICFIDSFNINLLWDCFCLTKWHIMSWYEIFNQKCKQIIKQTNHFFTVVVFGLGGSELCSIILAQNSKTVKMSFWQEKWRQFFRQ